ncbi:MAG TPA: 30S ribosomal protein S6 [Bryobacteraceae bacterium]|nr:30S ribosomal protein S6 [Bryobacteraceae bacterium]
MRIYEELFIVRPDATEEEFNPIIEQVKGIVTAAGGTVDKEEKWGVRKLAYKIQKRAEGNYILIQFTAGPETVKEIERRLRVSDLVMKFITVRIDEKMKRIEKRKKAREKRAHRKPAPPVAAPQMPTAEQQMMGAVVPAMPGAPVAPGAPTPAAAELDERSGAETVSGEKE